MKFNFLSTAAFALGMSLSGFASAEVITVSESFDITEPGQDFTFSFDALPENIIGDIVFFVNASGDFNGSNEDLFIDLGLGQNISLDGNGIFANTVTGLEEVSFTSTDFSNLDVEFSAVFSADNLFTSLLGFNILASTTGNVTPFFARGFSNTDADFVEVGFTFDVAEVSEPTTLAIFGLGLMGLAARRFTKNA